MENILPAPNSTLGLGASSLKTMFNFRRLLPPEWTDIKEQGFCPKDMQYMRSIFERRQKIGKAVPFFHLGFIKLGRKYLTTPLERVIIVANGGKEDLTTLLKITVARKLLRPNERKQIIDYVGNHSFHQEMLQFEQESWAFCPLKLSCPALEKLNRLTDSSKELLVKTALKEFAPQEISELKKELKASHNKLADQGVEMRRLRREIRRCVKIYISCPFSGPAFQQRPLPQRLWLPWHPISFLLSSSY